MDKNVLLIMALELDMSSLYKLCSTNKKMNNLICNNQIFWRKKLNIEYPNTIDKFPYRSDFRTIYRSLKNKEEVTYYTFMANENPPIIFDFIKRDPINDTDYEFAEETFKEFADRFGEEELFTGIGNFPKGTILFLAFADDSDISLNKAYLTFEEAYNSILKVANFLIDSDYEYRDQLQQDTGMTFEQFHGGSLSEVKKRMREDLKSGYLKIKGFDNRLFERVFPINFLIKEIVLS